MASASSSSMRSMSDLRRRLLGNAGSNYVLVVDAGSSGSRLRLFAASASGLAEVKPSDDDSQRFETEPGLSFYGLNPEAAGPSLRVLLDAACGYVPEEQQASTPLFVKATAGMRLMPPSQLEAVLQSTSRYLANSTNNPFLFTEAEVLSGEEEAIFLFLSANVLLGALPGPPESTYGVLDMGGASLQIAFEPAASILEHEVTFYVDSLRLSIYARSFTQFGLTVAMQRAQAMAVARRVSASPASLMFLHPLPVDFPCYNRGYSQQENVSGTLVNLVGTGDSKACSRLALDGLHLEYECLLKPCSIMGGYMAPLRPGIRFVATGNFARTAQNLGLLQQGEARVLTPSQLSEAAEAWCGKTMAEASESGTAPWKYLRTACFGGHYARHVLNAFGFEDNSSAVTFAVQTAGSNAGWTLGAALYETQYMPLELPGRDADRSNGVLGRFRGSRVEMLTTLAIGVSLALVLTALCLACFYCVVRRRRKQQHGDRLCPDSSEADSSDPEGDFERAIME